MSHINDQQVKHFSNGDRSFFWIYQWVWGTLLWLLYATAQAAPLSCGPVYGSSYNASTGAYYQRDESGEWQAAILEAPQTILVECGQGDSHYRAGLCLDDIYEDVRW